MTGDPLRARRRDRAHARAAGSDGRRRSARLDEHWDGKGHPDGLAGEEIPLLGADRLPRADRPRSSSTSFGPDAAVDVAFERTGSWFDPKLVRVARLAPRGRELLGLARARTRGERRGARAGRSGSSWPTRRASTASPRPSPSVIDAKSPYTLPALRARGRDRRLDRHRARASRRPHSATCAAPRSCTTSASSASPT